jgi:hypothetical protein
MLQASASASCGPFSSQNGFVFRGISPSATLCTAVLRMRSDENAKNPEIEADLWPQAGQL